MQVTHREAEERYTVIRNAVLEELNRDFHSTNQPNLKARLIDGVALAQSKRWHLSPKRKVDWDWVEGYTTFKFRHPKRFEMALLINKTLTF